MITAIDVADGVVALINAGVALSLPKPAVRSVIPLYDKDQLTVLTVTVNPASEESSRITRESDEYTFEVTVGVQKSLEPENAEDTDTQDEKCKALAVIVSGIRDYLRGLSPSDGIRFLKAKIDPVYSTEHLACDGVFTSVITLTYKGME